MYKHTKRSAYTIHAFVFDLPLHSRWWGSYEGQILATWRLRCCHWCCSPLARIWWRQPPRPASAVQKQHWKTTCEGGDQVHSSSSLRPPLPPLWWPPPPSADSRYLDKNEPDEDQSSASKGLSSMSNVVKSIIYLFIYFFTMNCKH